MTEVEVIQAGDNGSVSLAGALTFESVRALYRESEKLFRGARPTTLIDLSAVTHVDSAGLALLLEWQAMQSAASHQLDIQNAPSSLMSLAQLCEADNVMNISGRDQVA